MPLKQQLRPPEFGVWMRGDRVGKKKTGHASWFKVFLNHQAIFDAVPEECVGRAIKAALKYLETGESPSGLDDKSSIVFAALKPSADASIKSYEKASEAGKKGNETRWKPHEVSGGDTTRYGAIPGDRVVSGGIEKIEDRRNNTGASAAPALGGGEQQWADPKFEKWMEENR